jgi:transposase
MNNIERYRELTAKGLNALQIAQRTGVKKNTVYKICKRHGILVPSVIAGKPNSGWRRA